MPPDAPLFSNILCVVDGTRASTAAVRMAACLAGPHGSLTLLAVTEESGAGVQATAAISPERVEHLLERARRVAERTGATASTVVDPGRPRVKVILDRAGEFDLLALGAPATSWFGGMLVGGVATAALRSFTTPTLFVRASFKPPLRGRRILVASDGLDGSDRIVALAGALAEDQQAPITLVHALGGESRMHPHRIQGQLRVLEAVAPTESLIVPGHAAAVIIAAARSSGAAITVIGSRGLGGLQAFSSVSRRVTHDSCSTLVLPPPR
jgi:nucleotide-binding universal stress UspA family protein